MPPLHTIAATAIKSLWLLWLAVWIICAFGNKRIIYRQPWALRLPYLVMAIGWFIAVKLMPHPFAPLFPTTPLTDILGTTLCTLGLAWAIWARAVLGGNWSGRVTLKENHELIQRGPYRVTRHPIYTGMLTALAGTILVLLPVILGAVWLLMLSATFILKLRQEESLMLRQFPEAYPAYKSRVKAALIPFLW